MKVFGLAILLTLGLFSANASAESCTALLKDNRGYTLNTFNSWGYDRRDACRNARSNCERMRRNGPYNGRNLRCVVPNHGGGNGHRITRSCSSSLVDRYNRVRRRFTGRASGYGENQVRQAACRAALRQCNRERSQTGSYNFQCRTGY